MDRRRRARQLTIRFGAWGVIVAAWAAGTAVRAEPYLAVRSGLGCASCHLNRTGGGGRNAYGSGFGARSLPWGHGGSGGLFDGVVHERVRVGADLRAAYVGTLPDPGPYVGAYRTREANLYVAVDVLPERLTLYADERFAPGGAASREAFALVSFPRGGLYAKAGRFYVPYGLRLLDDEAATRRLEGFSFDDADLGVEVGGRGGPWTWAAAVTNGTDGAAESDNGKQVTATGGVVRPAWRVMASVTTNDLPGRLQRDVAGVWAGGSAGPIVVLAAYDRIRDTTAEGARTDGGAAHLEIDATPRAGLTLRGWSGRFDPDVDAAGVSRQWGAGIDWTPWPGLQLRVFGRFRDGPADVAGARDDEAAAEVHVYF